MKHSDGPALSKSQAADRRTANADGIGVASSRRMAASGRQRLSDQEEAWIARQLANAPPLGAVTRHRIEELLSLPPDHLDVVGHEVRPA